MSTGRMCARTQRTGAAVRRDRLVGPKSPAFRACGSASTFRACCCHRSQKLYICQPYTMMAAHTPLHTSQCSIDNDRRSQSKLPSRTMLQQSHANKIVTNNQSIALAEARPNTKYTQSCNTVRTTHPNPPFTASPQPVPPPL